MGTSTYRTVKFTVSYGTRGTIGTRGFLALLFLYYYYCINDNKKTFNSLVLNEGHFTGMHNIVVTTTLSSSSITYEAGLSYWQGAVAAVVP